MFDQKKSETDDNNRSTLLQILETTRVGPSFYVTEEAILAMLFRRQELSI